MCWDILKLENTLSSNIKIPCQKGKNTKKVSLIRQDHSEIGFVLWDVIFFMIVWDLPPPIMYTLRNVTLRFM